ncbi:neuropeptide FF receptor 1-like isoform X2 [Alligator sinensis]|uniref:Neuropeptide FF receptor 1 n=1 Tax=Alligator sinensis TaxID=38654 RepID=A0A3Q0GLZ6_ALLSI|nr:neuropeptide FF receptor 1-like isoform X2 [Alligator sinensis]XP_025059258.1 neuropeptide FF receptor 1-like isoform X2 [Alligator sinensis]
MQEVLNGGSAWELTASSACQQGGVLQLRKDTAPAMDFPRVEMEGGTNKTILSLMSHKRNLTYSRYYQHSPAVAAIYIIAYVFIFTLCMVGNGLVCFIVLKNSRMRTVTNLFILNLAVSDLLVGIFCVPTTLVDNLITGWPFSNGVCKMSGLVQGTSVSSSVFTLVAVAVDRFRCIIYPFKSKLSLLTALNTIAIIWVLAITIMCPSAVMLMVAQVEDHYIVYGHNQSLASPLYSCYEAWPNSEMRKVYTTVLFAHIYVAPLTLIMVMYGWIGIKLYKSSVLVSRHRVETQERSGAAVSRRKVKVIKMLILVALLFMLSWLPLWTLMLLTDYTQLDDAQLQLLTGYIFPFAHWLAFSNSSVNPIIYGYFNENFKRGFQAAFKFQPCSHKMGPHEAYSERLTASTTGFGTRNKVFTNGESSDFLCLKTLPAKGLCPAQNGQAQTLGLPLENISKITPLSKVCKAWDA